MDFGFFIKKKDIKVGSGIEIETLPEHDEIVEEIRGSGLLSEGWIYPLLQCARLAHDEKGLNPPKIYSPSFFLPATHRIKIKDSTDQLEQYMISSVGFVNGLRLVPKEWGSFYRTAYKPEKLVDFVCTGNDEEKLINAFYTFFRVNSLDLNKKFFGAIHWFLFSQSYIHDFEVFDAQYKVTDTLAEILRIMKNVDRPPHSRRCEFLSDELGVPLPSWAVPRDGQKSVLVELRNDFTHEAIYAGEPIGFSFPDENISFQLTMLNSRFIVAMTVVECKYIHTKCDTRSTFALKMNL